MSLRTAIYVRVSTDDQRDSGYSIDSQIRELTNYCKKKKYDIVDIYNDAGYSGKNMNRPNIQRLLNDIKRGCIDIVLAVKVDRLTRSNYDGQNLLKTLEKYNVQLELIYEQYDIDNHYGEMMFGMNLLFAQRERKEISARTKKCLEEAVKEGKYPTQCPLGYVRNQLGHLEVDPVSSLVVKDIFELYASGMSMNAIAVIFEEEKRYNKKNTRWREDKIKKILNNPIYKGECHWRRSTTNGKNPIIVIPNHSPKIVSDELFDRCQEQIEKNKLGGYGKNINIFQSIVKCPYCSKTMSNYYTIKKRPSGDKEIFFVCCRVKSCKGHKKTYNTEKIENALIELLNLIAIDYKENKYSLLLPYQEKNSELNDINKALDKLEKEQKKLMELYLNSSIDIGIINDKSQSIQNEINKLNMKKVKLEEYDVNTKNYSLKEMLDNKNHSSIIGFDNAWNLLDRKDKKMLISKYIKSIEIESDDKHNIAIKKVNFYNEFIDNDINNLIDIAMKCIKESNKNLVIKKATTEKKFNENCYLSLTDNTTKLWDNLKNENAILYPIYDKDKILKDIRIKLDSVS